MSISIGTNAKEPILKIWESRKSPSGKSIILRATTSRKNQDGTYENSHWDVLLVGNAMLMADASPIEKASFIKILGGSISTTSYIDKETQKKRNGTPQITVWAYEPFSWDQYRNRNTVDDSESDGDSSPY